MHFKIDRTTCLMNSNRCQRCVLWMLKNPNRRNRTCLKAIEQTDKPVIIIEVHDSRGAVRVSTLPR